MLISDNSQDQTNLPQYIEKRGNYVKRAELIDYYIGIGEYTAANNEISMLQVELNTMNSITLNSELLDFIDLKTYVLSELTQNGPLKVGLNPSQITFFTNAKSNYTGRAAIQASNILCFYADICDEDRDDLELGLVGKAQNTYEETEQSWTALEPLIDFTLYPNPNNGTFVIRGIDSRKLKRIEVRDIQGKLISFQLIRINESTVQIEFGHVKRGLYLVSVWNENDEKQTIRLVKN